MSTTTRKVSSRGSKALTVSTSSLARQVQPRLKKVGAALAVAKRKAATAIAKNPFGAIAGASAFGFAVAKLKRFV
jgi:hypothetical protein